MSKKVIMIVMDGWGIAPSNKGNYIVQARTPNFNHFLSYPHTKLKASGKAVGLPAGAEGNSEVGHLHLGAGKLVIQLYTRINKAIKDKTFFENKALMKAIDFAKKHNSALHLIGLCSDAGVHSHLSHLLALLKLAKKKKIERVFIHFIADGRDVPERSARDYIKIIEKKIRKTRAKIVTVVGRYYAMDRDNNWNRTKKAYEMLTGGKGFRAKSASEAIELAYRRGNRTDYYIEPTIIKNGVIKDNDSVIFFNFRTDRPRQLTEAFVKTKFNHFKRKVHPRIFFTTMTKYSQVLKCPFAFEENSVKNNLGKILAKHKLKQLRIAETEKYAHVTYFFNSQVEGRNQGEKYILIPSLKVQSYDKKPEMSAFKIAKRLEKEIKKKKFDFILVNFANCDLVGHSAVKKAIVKAVEVVDCCIGKVVRVGLKNGYTLVLTADHGSAEDKLYPDGKPKPSHSTNPVNFIIVSEDERIKGIRLRKGELKNVAPTILDIMGIKKPKEMAGLLIVR